MILIVDNEAESGVTNCMTINVILSKRVLIFHGPKVCVDQFAIYAKLEALGAICHTWGTLMESDYPNIVDMQDHCTNIIRHPHPLSLKDAGKMWNLPIQKSECHDYDLFTRNTLTIELSRYALQDVIGMETLIRCTAPKNNRDVLIRLNSLDYKITDDENKIYDGPEDASWCDGFNQCMTYSQLEDLISRENGTNYSVIDFGASSDMYTHSKKGQNCVS